MTHLSVDFKPAGRAYNTAQPVHYYYTSMDTTNIHGLPKPLQALFKQLLTNNILKSWNLYSNKFDQLVLNVKFDISEPGVEGLQDQACLFRRVNSKQQSRNIARAVTHNKKRKINPTTPEQSRDMICNYHSDDVITHDYHLDIIDSPESVQSSTMDNSKEEYHSMEHKEEYHNIKHKEEYHAISISHPSSHCPNTPVPEKVFPPVLRQLPPPVSEELSPPVTSPVTLIPNLVHENTAPENTAPENTETISKQLVKCPCCSETMTPSHTCSDIIISSERADNFPKVLSTPTVSLGTPIPSPLLTSKIPIIPHPKPPDRLPFGTRWASRPPTSSDKCNHLQPCIFC
jgi:hypothetical protein